MQKENAKKNKFRGDLTSESEDEEEEKKQENNEMEDDHMDKAEMIDETETGTGDPSTCIVSFKNLVISTLEENNLLNLRASKMEILDFLNLLNVLNQKGIHFS